MAQPTKPTSATVAQEWLTPQQLADELHIPLATLYQWRYRDEGPVGHRIGRHVRYRRSDIERWLAEVRDPRSRDDEMAGRS
ncbi:MAG: helix-turn-helix domain-containing protein [Acidimicrobiales bacterium]